MAQVRGPSRGTVDRLREIQINPVILMIVALLIAGGSVYVLWLRPVQEADRIKREWTNPEAAKARSPEGKPSNPEHERFIEGLRRKERAEGALSVPQQH